ncbi:MAG: hypothetical protein HRT90_08675 [Candidatus Margulisbacteria bacterium]|nr:hypothetical protein [Candidatus Margulisiibacteriota bacterium]
METKLKHLELVQGVMNRMAGNSFFLKGWSITLILALLALAEKDKNQFFIYLAFFPCVVFWSLDGYFLWQEKMYRKLYQKVSETEPVSIDFNMNTSKYKNEVDSWLTVCFSVTLVIFHGAILCVIVLTILIIIFAGSA